jgi:hypothetical protein
MSWDDNQHFAALLFADKIESAVAPVDYPTTSEAVTASATTSATFDAHTHDEKRCGDPA